MKRSFKLGAMAVAYAAGVMVSAGAANFTSSADRLHEVGLFQGTGMTASGAPQYDLDRAPTRAEAAVMLVRLLGKEADAKTLTYTAPFTDLEGWEAPYVQYLYDNKLTTGATATTFEPKAKCSAQMYTTFLLRSLGYSDAQNGDFAYTGALDFAADHVGLIDESFCDTNNFLRDNVAAMSLEALATPVKATDITLLDKLIADGAIDQIKAAPLSQFIDLAESYNKTVSTPITRAEQDVTARMTMKASGMEITTDSVMNTKAYVDPDKLKDAQMEITGTTTTKVTGSEPVVSNIKACYTGGVYYMDMGDGVKVKMTLDLDELTAQLHSFGVSDAGVLPLCYIKNIKQSGSDLTVTYDGSALNSTINKILTSYAGSLPEGSANTKVEFKDTAITMTVRNGQLAEVAVKGTVKITAEGETVSASMDVKSVVKATGSAVKISIPSDLSSYIDMVEYLKQIHPEGE